MAKKNSANQDKPGPKSIQNRRARFDYAVLETYEAGIVLQGSEVKSLFLGRANLTDAYCLVRNGELFLLQLDIEPYEQASHFAHERRRDRKLLLHRREINTLDRKSMEKGLAIIPLAVFFKGEKRQRAKVEIGLCRGKAQYDKRLQIAKDDTRRELERLRSGRD